MGQRDMLESCEGKVSWTAQCADHTERSGTGIHELLDFDNVASRKIEDLNITAHNYSHPRDEHFSVGISIHGSYDPAGRGVLRADVDGPTEFVDRNRRELEHWLRGLRAWYWPATRVNILTVMIAVFVITITYGVVFDTAQFFGLIEGTTTPNTPAPLGVLIAAVGIFLAFVWGVIKIRERIFPNATFAIGQGTERYERLEYVRRFVSGAAALGTFTLLARMLW